MPTRTGCSAHGWLCAARGSWSRTCRPGAWNNGEMWGCWWWIQWREVELLEYVIGQDACSVGRSCRTRGVKSRSWRSCMQRRVCTGHGSWRSCGSWHLRIWLWRCVASRHWREMRWRRQRQPPSGSDRCIVPPANRYRRLWIFLSEVIGTSFCCRIRYLYNARL
jgi:hypothetical protein